MAAKKKPNPSASEANASTEAQPSNNIIVPINADNNRDHSEDLEVEVLADGGLEVDLHDPGMKRIRRELTAAFRAPKPEEVNSCAFHNLKQGGSSLQEYLHNLVKLRARAPNVDEKTIIDAAIVGLSLGPCGEYLERRRPKTLSKLFEIMQEYCVSDIGKHRRIEEMNEKRGRNRDRPNQYQSEQAKTSKAVNTVSGNEARDSRPQNNRGGRSDRSNSNRGWTPAGNKKSPTAAFTAETKATGLMSAPSSRRKKKSWSEPQTTNSRRSP